jgi:hypothetical protein
VLEYEGIMEEKENILSGCLPNKGWGGGGGHRFKVAAHGITVFFIFSDILCMKTTFCLVLCCNILGEALKII